MPTPAELFMTKLGCGAGEEKHQQQQTGGANRRARAVGVMLFRSDRFSLFRDCYIYIHTVAEEESNGKLRAELGKTPRRAFINFALCLQVLELCTCRRAGCHVSWTK